MTLDEFSQFYLLVQNDHAAVNKLKSAPNQDAFFSTLMNIGQEKGYRLDVGEVKKLAKMSAIAGGGSARELSEAELQKVAGGGDCGCFGTWDGGKSTNW